MANPSSSGFMPMLISGRIFVDVFQDVYFNSSAISIFKHASEDYPNLLPKIQRKVLEFEPKLSASKLKSISYRYAQAYIMEFPPQDFEPEINILLASDVAMYLDKLVRDRLNHLLKDKFNIKITTDSSQQHIDLVLSTGVISKKFDKSRKIYINAEVTKKDGENIIKACRDILIEKRNKKEQSVVY